MQMPAVELSGSQPRGKQDHCVDVLASKSPNVILSYQLVTEALICNKDHDVKCM